MVDGHYDDWTNKDINQIDFEATRWFGGSNLSGTLTIQNNLDSLKILMYLKTPYSLENRYHSMMFVFDENADGVHSEGDDVLRIMTEGDGNVTVSKDGHYGASGNMESDPIDDLLTSQAKIRYISDNEMFLEASVPYVGTNNFYDIEMNVARDIGLNFNYMTEDEFFENDHTFGAGFYYTVAQDSSVPLGPGLQILSAFGIFALVSVVGASKLSVHGSVKKSFDKKSLAIILSILGLSIVATVLPSNFASVMSSYVNPISVLVDSVGFLPLFSLSVLLGIVVGIFCYFIFKNSRNLLDAFSLDQKIVLYSCVGFFIIGILVSAFVPFLTILVSGAKVAPIPLEDFEFFKEQVLFALGLIQNVYTVSLLPGLMSILIWIPSIFLYWLSKEIKKSNLSLSKKIMFVFFAIASFLIFAIWSTVNLHYSSSTDTLLFHMLIGPAISSILISFLAAEGYVLTIKNNLYRLRHGMSPESTINSHSLKQRLLAIVILIPSVIGVLRYLLLLTIPLAYLELPQFYTMVNESFVGYLTSYAETNIGQNPEGSKFIYNYSILIFSLFWLYDIAMILKGFAGEYLNSENPIYRYVSKNIGLFSGVAFLSFIMIFMSFQSILLDSSRIYEYDDLFPQWVIEEQGLQDLSNATLDELSVGIDFVIGIATLLGLIYVVRKSKLSKIKPTELK